MSLIVLNRTALHEQICEAIRERILDGEYKPGERLNIDQLARAMNVSSTPVREALARLISERLVSFQPNKGYRVTPPPDAGWLADLFDVRMLLEPYAARVGAGRRDAAVLARLEELQGQIAQLDPEDPRSCQLFVRLNQAFHTIIIDSAGNRALSEQYTTLSYHAQIALVYRLGLKDIPQVLQEHVPLLDAFRSGDGQAAEAAMCAHIAAGKARAVTFVAQTVPAESPGSASTADQLGGFANG